MRYKEIVITLLLSWYVFSSIAIVAQNKSEVDSVVWQIVNMPDDTNKVASLNKYSFSNVSNFFDTTFKYAEQAYVLSNALNYRYGAAISLMNIGTAYLYKGDFNNAVIYYDSSNVLMQNTNNYHFKAQIENNLGLAYFKLEKLEVALIHYYKAYNLKKDYLNSESIERTLGNISLCYYHQEKYDEVLKINFELIELFTASNYEIGLSNLYVSIGQVYLAKNELNEALVYLDKASIIAEKLDNNRMRAMYLSTLSEVYTMQEKYREAIEINIRTIDIIKKLKAKEPLAYNYLYLATNYYHIKQYKQAIFYCNKSIDISNEIELKKLLLEAHKLLADINNDTGNYKEAYDNAHIYIELYESVFNEVKQKQIEELETKYETAKKEQEIISLTQEKELQAAESKNKTYFIIVLFLIILIAGIVVYFYLKNQKDKHLRKVIEERAKEAENQKRRFAKELHDGTGSNLTGIRLQLLSLKDDTNSNIVADLIKEVDRTHQGVRLISYQAAPPEFENYTLDEAISDLVRRLTKTGSIKIHYSSTVSLSWLTVSKDYQLSIYRIIQEALSNIIKHSEAGNVDIQIVQHDDIINLMIDDDGKGFDAAIINAGLGLRNMKERALSLNAIINIDSALKRGTTIILEIPIPKNI